MILNVNFSQPMAIAQLSGIAENGPTGTVAFYPYNSNTLVMADIYRLPHENSMCSSGIFGFHIHEGESCSGTDFSETKGHLNPSGCDHPHHAGDLPPLFECNGRAFLAVLTDRFQIADVIGKTVVIHSNPDDFTSQPSGNSGKKIACGVIHPV